MLRSTSGGVNATALNKCGSANDISGLKEAAKMRSTLRKREISGINEA